MIDINKYYLCESESDIVFFYEKVKEELPEVSVISDISKYTIYFERHKVNCFFFFDKTGIVGIILDMMRSNSIIKDYISIKVLRRKSKLDSL